MGGSHRFTYLYTGRGRAVHIRVHPGAGAASRRHHCTIQTAHNNIVWERGEGEGPRNGYTHIRNFNTKQETQTGPKARLGNVLS